MAGLPVQLRLSIGVRVCMCWVLQRPWVRSS